MFNVKQAVHVVVVVRVVSAKAQWVLRVLTLKNRIGGEVAVEGKKLLIGIVVEVVDVYVREFPASVCLLEMQLLDFLFFFKQKFLESGIFLTLYTCML